MAQWVKDLALSLCGLGLCCGTGSFPGLGTSTCTAKIIVIKKKKKPIRRAINENEGVPLYILIEDNLQRNSLILFQW